MNEIQVFKFETNEVRAVIIESEPWFVGKDVATMYLFEEVNYEWN